MDDSEFWDILALSQIVSDGSTAAQARALRSLLLAEPPEQVAAFDALFVQHNQQLYSYGLWGVAYVLMSGCSDDSFTDFRSWVVAQGRSYFGEVLSDPLVVSRGRLTDPDEVGEAESLSYVASQVYEEKTQRDIFTDYPGHPNMFDVGDPEGEPWDEEEVEDLYPGLKPLIWKQT